MNRRKFISKSALSSLGLAIGTSVLAKVTRDSKSNKRQSNNVNYPLVIATWNVPNAVAKARDVILAGAPAIDAVEQGCNVEEEDPSNSSVGYGGLPDRDGHVSLDACIMDDKGNYGAVVFLEEIVNAISVARKVMEKTPHVLLAGEGAKQFAEAQGFKRQNLLTEETKNAWKDWLKKSEYKPIINIENHDTIGMLAMDIRGNLSGGCTTSGLAYKMHGRVGDSPIIGSGLYVDNEIGAATATGVGEEVLKTVGAYLVVELMRQGKTPEQACKEAIGRIMKKQPERRDFQVAYIAVNKKGEVGAFSIHPGFSYTIFQQGKLKNIKPAHWFD